MSNDLESKDGKSLERLVELIEGVLRPRGFTIETRKRIYGERGVQVAELDIVISGHIGTAPVQSLIECRDRPSEGPAPSSWIEQLVGRKLRFGFNTVMAVSTTGFVQAAIDEAKRFGILLRTIEEMTESSFLEWFPITVPIEIHEHELISVKIFMDSVSDPGKAEPREFRFDATQAVFITGEARMPTTLRMLWTEILNDHNVFSQAAELGTSYMVTVRKDFASAERLLMQHDGFEKSVDAIEFTGTVKRSVPAMSVVQGAHYSAPDGGDSGQEQLLKLAEWKGNENDVIKGLTILAFPKKQATDK